MGDMRNAYKISIAKFEWKRPPEVLEVDERIILEWILEKQIGKVCNEFIWVKTGTSGGLL
jgi:hypothetical protein